MSLHEIRQRLKIQLQAGVHAALTPFVHHMALLVRTMPHASADDLLGRPDAAGYQRTALGSAQAMASALVRQAWEAGGGPPGSPVLQALLQDVSGAYLLAASSVRTAIRQAFASVPEPGADRAAAVADAIRSQSDRLVASGHGALSVAASGSRSAGVLEEGRRRQAAGEHVGKRWVSRLLPSTCRWCRALHGTVIPLDAEFSPGEPYETHGKLRHVRTPAGERHFHREIGSPIIFTYPPRVWGSLLGPPRHPECECELELVTLGAGEGPAAALPPAPEQGPPFLRASDIAGLPDAQYHSLLSFISAAVHELRLLLRRLLGL